MDRVSINHLVKKLWGFSSFSNICNSFESVAVFFVGVLSDFLSYFCSNRLYGSSLLLLDGKSDVRLLECYWLGGVRLQDELPSNSFDMLFAKARYAVALQDSDSKSLELSASGGAFALFARSVLRVGGAVFGASLLDNGTVRHICIKRIDDFNELQDLNMLRATLQIHMKSVPIFFARTP